MPLARQKLLASKPNLGETINNFITHLQSLAEHCDYSEQEDNRVINIVISHITNKELKGKFYRGEILSLTTLLEIMTSYHYKDSLILVSEETVNCTWEDRSKGDKGAKSKQPWQGKCGRCDTPGHVGKDCEVSRNHTCSKCGKHGYMEVCCHTKQDKHGKGRGKSGRKRVEKPNVDVCICLDMRQANREILREKHPVPTIEGTLQEISGAKVFSKLDLNVAFHQVELVPESRDITTFSGPNGLYRYKRLIFGVNMATEKFQHIIWQIPKDCPGSHNIHDDIRVVGASEEEHDEILNQVMKKLEESGLTLNYDKCQIGVRSMEYLGNMLTDEGLQVH